VLTVPCTALSVLSTSLQTPSAFSRGSNTCLCSVVRFEKGEKNVLVASDVLEEGIDIQKCNLVVKFDMPKTYRSYVQSKGRARHRNSKYYILVPHNMEDSFTQKYNSYRETEQTLKKVSTKQTGSQEFTYNEEEFSSSLPFLENSSTCDNNHIVISSFL
jgi:ERCC4-related helicase